MDVEDASETKRRADAARGAALELLTRRPLSRHELRERLIGRDHLPDVVDAVIESLGRAGHVDDRRLAVHYISTRAARLGHGPRRLIHALIGRGVEEELARAAWDEAVAGGEVDPAELIRRQVRRRVGRVDRLDRAEYRRVYNALLRAGFTTEEIRQQLPPLRSESDHEVNDDFA